MPEVIEQVKEYIEDVDKELNNIWKQKKQNFSVEENRLQALDYKIQSIESLISEVTTGEKGQDLKRSKDADAAIREVREVKKYQEKLLRERQLLNPKSKLERKQALWWFSQQGGRKELPIIQAVRAIPPYSDDPELQNLLERTQKEIESRLFAKGVYQVFCSEAEIKELGLAIVVIESYEAFVIISVDESIDKEAIAQIKKQYPLEKLEYQSSSVTPMPKKEQIVTFNFPVREDWKKRIENTDAKILQPLGNSKFVVSVPNKETLAQIKKIREVASVTPYEPTIRVQEEYLEGLGEEITEEMLAEARLKLVENSQDVESSNIIPGILIATFFTEEDCNQALKILESQGIDIVE